jgi:NADH:ubiquinone oxidoreductase subunit E
VRGGTKIVKAVKDKLGIDPGETTDDFEFSVEGVACLGACALAPVMVVNGQVFGNMTPDRVVDILDELL